VELEKSIIQEEKREERFTELSKKILNINNEVSSNNIKISQLNKQTGRLFLITSLFKDC